jgi:hypothetical protein
MTSHLALRELGPRTSDGFDVRLPWNPLPKPPLLRIHVPFAAARARDGS